MMAIPYPFIPNGASGHQQEIYHLEGKRYKLSKKEIDGKKEEKILAKDAKNFDWN